ncbi:MAG: hypothetical protein ABIV48_13685 [Pyrinomonadaceae bacterium]
MKKIIVLLVSILGFSITPAAQSDGTIVKQNDAAATERVIREVLN